jgi:hypothetical protein
MVTAVYLLILAAGIVGIVIGDMSQSPEGGENDE